MSEATYTYPRTGGLALADNASFVREEGEEYRPFSSLLLDTIDIVNEKLPQARAVAYLMEARVEPPEGTFQEAGALIARLIDDVMQAHKALDAARYREHLRKSEG